MVQEVLRATATELARAGYAALRVEDVAAQAGVNKTTVYRRWPTKAELVAAALRSKRPLHAEAPDTGSVQGDLMRLLREFVAQWSTPEGRGIARMIMAELDHPEVDALARSLNEEFRAPWYAVLKRAVERGELPAGTDARLVTEMLLSTVRSRLLRLNAQADEEFLTAVVELVLVGAKGRGTIRR